MIRTVQALVHTEQQQQQNDDYYKRIGISGDDSSYSAAPGYPMRDSSLIDHETDRSLGNEMDAGGPVVVSVPTMIRQDDDAATITDGGDSLYNPHYSIQSYNEVKYYNNRFNKY